MVTIVNTITVQAMKAIPTEVQTSIYNGIPSFHIVGMVNKSVNESAIRIRTAINSLGFDMPAKKIVVNLSPTNIIKEGNYYDLPIAIGILFELEIIKNIDLKKFLIIGELSLDARVKNVNVALIASIYAKTKNLGLICPFENGRIAALSFLDEIIPTKNLIELIWHFNTNNIKNKIHPMNPPVIRTKRNFEQDFSMIKKNLHLKKALKIIAAGGHSILMQGPPGLGKTFAAEALRSILPDLSVKEIIEILLIKNTGQKEMNSSEFSKIDCAQEEAENTSESSVLEIERPFRNPHHSASVASIVGGGGRIIEPGEITLAHNGVLFLDELPEFSQNVLDALREPLEKKEINITRAERNVTYPANFQLVCALNPCKCGYFGVKDKQCSRAPSCAASYQKKISGPLLDRIDLFVYLGGCNIHDCENEKIDIKNDHDFENSKKHENFFYNEKNEKSMESESTKKNANFDLENTFDQEKNITKNQFEKKNFMEKVNNDENLLENFTKDTNKILKKDSEKDDEKNCISTNKNKFEKEKQNNKIFYQNDSESTESVREEICKAREKQETRFAELNFKTNASAKSSKNFVNLCKLEKTALQFLENLLDSEKINQRTFIKTISISRTIADLENEENINKNHILEALYFKKNNNF